VGLILNSLLNGLLESRTESLQEDWLCKSKQELMLGLCELNVEVLDVNLDISRLVKCSDLPEGL
jgi:hypothetical protein